MSKKRQSAVLDPRGEPDAKLTTLSYEYKDGSNIPAHFHQEDQVVFAIKGVMTVKTDEGVWIVPPLRAVWIPGAIIHSIDMAGDVSMRTLYFSAKFVRALPRKCMVMSVSPLLRELIVYACLLTRLSLKVRKERNTIEMIVDQLDAKNKVPLQLPVPRDPRAKKVANILLADPGAKRRLQSICEECGASIRTIERIFFEETHMTLGKWRQQLRVLLSIQKLIGGEKILTVAMDAGYNSPSAFISAFRKTLGRTPSEYCESKRG